MYLSISTIIYYWILTAIIQPQTVRQQNTMDVFASSIGIITLITITTYFIVHNNNKWIRHKFYNLEMFSPLVTSIYI